MEKYETVKDIGSGCFAVARLLKHRKTGELVAVKFIPRGENINDRVAMEIINHRSLRHPNIIQFIEVVLTPTHLGIVMEYAAGGELFDRINRYGRFGEAEARFFFQQLMCGVSYCHYMQICHRDLKLENALLNGNLKAPRLKICDFGYSKSSVLHSRPKSTVGTPAYIAPEILSKKEYDGKLADVWSCGVTLYVMLVGEYPFEDPKDAKNYKKTISKILAADYKIPENVKLSPQCMDLLSRIFEPIPSKRITIEEIKKHPWFQFHLPIELSEEHQHVYYKRDASSKSLQSVDEIMNLINEAKTVPTSAPGSGYLDAADSEVVRNEDEDEDEHEKRVNEVEAIKDFLSKDGREKRVYKSL